MIHSRTKSKVSKRVSIFSTVSSMTSSTLKVMSTNKPMSNARDSGVSWSKMMWRARSRQPVVVCTWAAYDKRQRHRVLSSPADSPRHRVRRPPRQSIEVDDGF